MFQKTLIDSETEIAATAVASSNLSWEVYSGISKKGRDRITESPWYDVNKGQTQ